MNTQRKEASAMSVGYSSIQLIGYLGNDPRPLHAVTGTQGVRFSLAVNRVWTDESGARQKNTDWFSVVAWERLAENCLSFLTKGSLVFVIGKPRIQRWKERQAGGREQIQVLADQVIFLDRPESGEDQEE
jgi:single-strand DNA-binding protein